jgi:diguanylate cyclase (GGDEF)-like protein
VQPARDNITHIMSNEPKPSQPTLGLLRRMLEEMEPESIITPYERKKFWKDTLFDFGFAPATIQTLSHVYNFEWGEIIPALYTLTFPFDRNPFVGRRDSEMCQDILKQLLAFAVHHYREKRQAEKLIDALALDGFEVGESSEADYEIPAELAQLPGKSALIADTQRRIDSRELVSAIYIDLDNFKAVNDTSGHTAGDECLIRLVRMVSATILGKGKLYRAGLGDEFVILLPNFSVEEAKSTAERIRSSIDQGNPGGEFKITASIGVASSTSAKVTSAEALIELADKMMYVAKKSRNCVVADSQPDA